MNFTEESITAARTSLNKLKAAYRRLAAGQGNIFPERHGPLVDAVDAALSEDLNTSAALAALHQFAAESAPDDAALRVRAAGEFMYALSLVGLTPDAEWFKEPTSAALPADFLQRLRAEAGASISLNGSTPGEAVERVIAARNQARASKDWAESDRLRDVLARCGVAVKDSKEGTTWTVAE